MTAKGSSRKKDPKKDKQPKRSKPGENVQSSPAVPATDTSAAAAKFRSTGNSPANQGLQYKSGHAAPAATSTKRKDVSDVDEQPQPKRSSKPSRPAPTVDDTPILFSGTNPPATANLLSGGDTQRRSSTLGSRPSITSLGISNFGAGLTHPLLTEAGPSSCPILKRDTVAHEKSEDSLSDNESDADEDIPSERDGSYTETDKDDAVRIPRQTCRPLATDFVVNPSSTAQPSPQTAPTDQIVKHVQWGKNGLVFGIQH